MAYEYRRDDFDQDNGVRSAPDLNYRSNVSSSQRGDTLAPYVYNDQQYSHRVYASYGLKSRTGYNNSDNVRSDDACSDPMSSGRYDTRHGSNAVEGSRSDSMVIDPMPVVIGKYAYGGRDSPTVFVTTDTRHTNFVDINELCDHVRNVET